MNTKVLDTVCNKVYSKDPYITTQRIHQRISNMISEQVDSIVTSQIHEQICNDVWKRVRNSIYFHIRFDTNSSYGQPL